MRGLWAIVVLGLLGSAAVQAQPLAAPAELAPLLRAGGLVLYMRHPATEPGQTDAEPLDFADCTTQRNLSDGGRRSAVEIGAAMRRIGMRIGGVVTSEYCRAREAARLMEFPAETDALLNDGGRMLAKGPDSIPARALRTWLSRPPLPGTNLLIVAHRPNLVDAAGPSFADLGEGEVAVFRPSDGGFVLVARVRAADWPGL
ncbi:histidine phosphatase family protein [Plastoroseomonas hellenica]|uniref:hypothetical protein n=1 Tax=Plastoroseomonas hellenica TaxID=2687306 RepID=UPI001BACDFB8|nr:hypothetical protein [Plastoroseomonas hellenica]MBR0646398.1 hypothetical protein [Plastoroseomonas hellenica]